MNSILLVGTRRLHVRWRFADIMIAALISFLVWDGRSAWAGEVSLVPVDATGPFFILGNTITVPPGGTEVTLEVRVGGWDADCPGACDGSPLLGIINTMIDSGGFLGANAVPSNPGADLIPKGFPGTACEGGFVAGTVCSMNNRWCSGTSCTPACGGGEGTCVPNSDFVFGCCINQTCPGPGCASPIYGAITSTLDYEFGGFPFSGGVQDDGSSKYVGTLILVVPPAASGTYAIDFVPPPTTDLGDENQAVLPEATTTVGAVIQIGGTNPPLSAPPPHDVRKNRYISFDPGNFGEPMAYQVTMTSSMYFPGDVGVLGWVGTPDGDGIARIVASPVTMASWPAVVHVGDASIVPVADYEIRASNDGGGSFSAPLAVSTILKPGSASWGDMGGGAPGSAPDGITNVFDIAWVTEAANGTPVPFHVTRLDLAGAVPDKRVDCDDIEAVIAAFSGFPYPYAFVGGTGACCIAGDCSLTSELACVDAGGVYYPGEISCPGNACLDIQACCTGTACLQAKSSCCANIFDADPLGPGTVCMTPEACCGAGGLLNCSAKDPACCAFDGGTPVGPGSTCSGSDVNLNNQDDVCDGDACACNGDVNGDTFVNFQDLNDTIGCLGQPPTGPCAGMDVNCDGVGVVDEGDVDIVNCILQGGTIEQCCESQPDPPAPPSLGCTVDDDCVNSPGAPLCVNGSCQGCTTDADCTGAALCVGGVCYSPSNASLALTPGAAPTATSTANYDPAPDLAIPDCDGLAENPLSDTRTFTDCGAIQDVNVGLNISHTWVGDLIVTLTHVNSGTTVTLLSRVGLAETDPYCGTLDCCGSDLDDATITLDDSEVNDVENGPFPLVGSYRPSAGATGNPGVLSAFNGLDACSDWTLSVSDNEPQDVGVLRFWSLTVTRVVPPLVQGSSAMRSAGPGFDCDSNGINDECELDCSLPGCMVAGCGLRSNSEVAIRVKLLSSDFFPADVGSIRWIRDPVAKSVVGQPAVYTARLTENPMYRLWTEPLIYVGDCPIHPRATYEIKGVRFGDDCTLEGNYSRKLLLSTTPKPTNREWGDVCGPLLPGPGGRFGPPDGLTDFRDINCIINGFVGSDIAPVWVWLDVAEAGQDHLVNFRDVSAVVRAFNPLPAGPVYPYCGPSDCIPGWYLPNPPDPACP